MSYIYIYIYMEHLFLMFLDHTQRRTTVGRTPLDEWSARRRDLYLTTHDTHNRQISMPPVGFEPTISAGELRANWPQSFARSYVSWACMRHVFALCRAPRERQLGYTQPMSGARTPLIGCLHAVSIDFHTSSSVRPSAAPLSKSRTSNSAGCPTQQLGFPWALPVQCLCKSVASEIMTACEAVSLKRWMGTKFLIYIRPEFRNNLSFTHFGRQIPVQLVLLSWGVG